MVESSDLPPCPACGEPPVSSLACLACGEVTEEPAGSDHFTRLGLAHDELFDVASAEANYLKLSRALHPDFKAGADDDAMFRAVSHSALLNEAWAVLNDEQQRAEYLLELHHPGALEQHKSLSQEFLMEVMEISEELEDAKDEGCADTIRTIASSTREALRSRMNGVAHVCGATIDRIAHEADPPDVPERERRLHPHEWNSERVATLLHQARVYRRILRDAGEKH
jgi:Fe-S protein assembly co-chaperone HscB